MFNLNSGFLFLITGLFILFVVVQSLFYLIRAYKEGVAIGMDKRVLNRTIQSSAVFTIAPAVSILLGVLTLSKFLGLPLPWLRLSVLGAITYELTAATSAASSLNVSICDPVASAETFTTITWVMTLGIIPSLVLIPAFLKKYQKKMENIKKRDSKWSEYFITAIFLGMISAFLGVVFKDISQGIQGFIGVFVMLFSALIMTIIGLLIKKFDYQWLKDYALPVSMISGMAFAIYITGVIGG